MKLLFISDHFVSCLNGGVSRVTGLLADEMEKRGHMVSFLSISDEKDSQQGIKRDQNHICITNMTETDFAKTLENFIKKAESDIIVLSDVNNQTRRIMRNLPKEIFKVVLLHHQPYSVLGKERMVLSLVPFSTSDGKEILKKYLGIWFPGIFRKLYMRNAVELNRFMISQSDKFVMLSERFRRRMVDNTPGIDEKKLEFINNPLTFDVVDNQLDITQKENSVLLVCRMINPQKNITGFIDVWNLFQKKHAGWKAYIVGNGEHLEFVKNYAKKKKTKNLEFVGARNDVEDYYKKSKILCLTSTFEGWGMVLTEAMALGCVPVAYDSYEAVYDIIDNGKNGCIVQAFNKDLMANALCRLADNPNLWNEMAKDAMEKVKSFAIGKIVDQWESKIFDSHR